MNTDGPEVIRPFFRAVIEELDGSGIQGPFITDHRLKNISIGLL